MDLAEEEDEVEGEMETYEQADRLRRHDYMNYSPPKLVLFCKEHSSLLLINAFHFYFTVFYIQLSVNALASSPGGRFQLQ